MRRSCSLCLLVLASCITFSFAQQQPSPGSLTCSPQAKAITVWKVGSPYQNGAPGKAISAGLKLKAKSLGCMIKVEVFPAVFFADSFFAAFEKHEEPDVLVVEHKGVISGITMRSGEYINARGGAVMRTPAAIEGIAGNDAISRALKLYRVQWLVWMTLVVGYSCCELLGTTMPRNAGSLPRLWTEPRRNETVRDCGAYNTSGRK